MPQVVSIAITTMALDLRKHFDEADKEKSGFIKYKGLQEILKGSNACDASMARKAVAIIMKNGKVSILNV